MCGLAGIYHFNRAPARVATLRRMETLLAHRGPDDAGRRLFSLTSDRRREAADDDEHDGFEGGVCFVRLSIQDLSPAGRQPMSDDAGDVILTFNGEIYNADALRAALQAQGACFRGRSDTEVVLQGYRYWGIERLLNELNGMFAFAVIDVRQKEISIVRDRFGVKPLYYIENEKYISFASEIKAFFALDETDLSLDDCSIDEFLMFRFVAGERTLFRKVRRLPPGCRLTVTPGGTTLRRYWSPPRRAASYAGDRATGQAQVMAALDAAVARQLAADVPVGTQLSGGVDSSLVTALAARRLTPPVHAFSVVFDDPRFSEEPWIDHAATVIGNLNVHKIKLDADDVFRSLDAAGWFMDQPVGHPNSLGLFKLARCARPHVAVLLSGEGADEVFAGYYRYLYPQWGARLGPFLPLLTRLPVVGEKFNRRFSARRDLDAGERFILSNAYIRPETLRRLRPQADSARPTAGRRARFGGDDEALLDRCLRYDLETTLPDLLTRQDKMTMAHGVENRVPFLDNALFDLAWRLPREHLLHPGFGLEPAAARSTKIPLKAAAAGLFGDAFARRPKSGFALPLAALLRDRRAMEAMAEIALPALRDQAGISMAAVAALSRRPETWTAADTEMLWILLSFGCWLSEYTVKGKAVAGAPFTLKSPFQETPK